MDAYVTARISGWCALKLENLNMRFYEGETPYELPVSWVSQKSGLIPRCMRPDDLFCMKLTDLSVNDMDATGLMRFFARAEVISCGITVRGTGKKDFQMESILFCDQNHQHLQLPKSQLSPLKVSYKSYKSVGKLSSGFPRAVKDSFGHIGCCREVNVKQKTGKYLFDNGAEKEFSYKDLKKIGCGKKCIV